MNIYSSLREIALSIVSCCCKCRFGMLPCRHKIRIGLRTKIYNPSQLQINGDVRIFNDCVLNPHGGGKIILGKNVDVGAFSNLSANNLIEIGNNVLLAPNVFISDHNHAYEQPNLPIREQGQREHDAVVIIGADSWIGKNVVIVGNVRIGKHCVIGANSVVVGDVLDYSVAVGSPARPIKRFDQNVQKWERVVE